MRGSAITFTVSRELSFCLDSQRFWRIVLALSHLFERPAKYRSLYVHSDVVAVLIMEYFS